MNNFTFFRHKQSEIAQGHTYFVEMSGNNLAENVQDIDTSYTDAIKNMPEYDLDSFYFKHTLGKGGMGEVRLYPGLAQLVDKTALLVALEKHLDLPKRFFF